jgi:PAS domain-containing protein
LLLAACLFLVIFRKKFEQKMVMVMGASIIFSIISEIFFTQYVSVSDRTNLLGHLFRALGIYMIYWAIVVSILEKPMAILFKNLKTSEEKYNAIIDNMNSGVAIYRPTKDGKDFIIQDLNKSGEFIDNILKEEVIGKKLTKAFPGVKPMGLFEVLRRVNASGNPESLTESQYRDERISGWRRNYVYKLSTGEIVAVYDDITKEKQAEMSLSERAKETEKFNQLLVGRENKMTELKEEVSRLKKLLGEK